MKAFLIRTMVFGIHLIALLGILFSQFNIWSVVLLFTVMWGVFGLGITVGYHRYFAHKSYKTSRIFQFFLALWGCLACQGGPLFWSAVHRHHHQNSDEPEDIHTPKKGFWYAHMGWLANPTAYQAIDYHYVRDLEKYPELVLLERFYLLPPLLFAVGLIVFSYLYGLNTHSAVTPLQLVTWGFFAPLVFAWHTTWCINSLTHIFGKRRFSTNDNSRNFWFLGIHGLGEGWHNNHHRLPVSARLGLRWYEIDVGYYVLLLLKRLGLVWDIYQFPKHIIQREEQRSE